MLYMGDIIADARLLLDNVNISFFFLMVLDYLVIMCSLLIYLIFNSFSNL